MGIQR